VISLNQKKIKTNTQFPILLSVEQDTRRNQSAKSNQKELVKSGKVDIKKIVKPVPHPSVQAK
jgi:hypothetical protein